MISVLRWESLTIIAGQSKVLKELVVRPPLRPRLARVKSHLMSHDRGGDPVFG